MNPISSTVLVVDDDLLFLLLMMMMMMTKYLEQSLVWKVANRRIIHKSRPGDKDDNGDVHGVDGE